MLGLAAYIISFECCFKEYKDVGNLARMFGLRLDGAFRRTTATVYFYEPASGEIQRTDDIHGQAIIHGNLSRDIVFAKLYKLCVNTVWYALSIHLRNTIIASLNGHSFFKCSVSWHFLLFSNHFNNISYCLFGVNKYIFFLFSFFMPDLACY